MLTGWQIYSASILPPVHLTIPLVEFCNTAFPEVDKVEVESSTGEWLSIKVVFGEVSSEEDARSIGQVIADQVADRVAFSHKVRVGDPLTRNGSFHAIGEEDHGSVSTDIHVPTMHVPARLAVKQENLPQLKSLLEDDHPAGEQYYSQYRWILRQEDPVARFMHFYRMLLSLVGGPNHTQSKVDEFIESIDPSVQKVHNAHLGRDETIFTRLRNEVGHEISGATPQSTRQGMESHVRKLADHAKVAIARVP